MILYLDSVYPCVKQYLFFQHYSFNFTVCFLLILGDKDPLFPYYYMPFSRGSRMCIGYRFALMEMKVVLAQILNKFSFRIAKSQSPDINGLNILTYRPNPAPIIEIAKV